MNYIWEVGIQAGKQNLKSKDIRFEAAKRSSPYMEIADSYINQDRLDKKKAVEVNPYYRFHNIFKDFYHPEMTEYLSLRKSITNLIFHMICQGDRLSGMTKEEYHKKLLHYDFRRGMFGKQEEMALRLFNRDEQNIIFTGLLRQYENGNSLLLFIDILRSLIPDANVYLSRAKPSEISIYTRQKNEPKLDGKINFIINMFVGVNYTVERYHEHHFGIMGIDATMIMDEIGLC